MPERTMAIRCAYTELADVEALTPHPRNPNTHGKKQLRLLAKIMRHQGWRNPIVVSKRSGFVIKGHGRLLAARLNGWVQVPIDTQDYDNEAQEYQDLVADNRIAELAEIDADALRALAKEQDDGTDFEMWGFDKEAQAKELFASDEDDLSVKDQEDAKMDEQFMVLINCNDEREQGQLLERLSAEGLRCKALIS